MSEMDAERDNPQVIYDGNKVYFQVSRDGVVIRERIPSHMMKMDHDRALVYIEEICNKASKQLNAACQFEAMKQAADKENERLTLSWKINNQIELIKSIPKDLWKFGKALVSKKLKGATKSQTLAELDRSMPSVKMEMKKDKIH
jgi:hypothetical protein